MRRMETKRRRLRTNSGFTFVELLIVIAIIMALAVIGFMSVRKTQQNMEQAKLDRIAENLYTAAQNQLSMRTVHREDAADPLKTANLVVPLPSDMDDASKTYFGGSDPASAKHQLLYVNSASGGVLAEDLFPAGSISEEARGGYWIVEFEPDSATVYSVFYSETLDPSASSEYELNDLRVSPGERIRLTHATVGYYSGEVAQLSSRKVGEADVKVEIENAEELTAKVTITLPSGGDWSGADYMNKDLDVTFKLTSLPSGKERTWKQTVLMTSNAPITLESGDFDGGVLDSLKSGKSFYEQFCASADGVGGVGEGDDLVPGEDIRLEVTVSCESDTVLLYPSSDSATANSLFADGSGAAVNEKTGNKMVYLAYGRHLQNLNYDSASDFYDSVPDFEAWQLENIGFGASSAWDIAYHGSVAFQPIKNEKVLAYYGAGSAINGLKVNAASGDAGLFAEFAGGTVQGVVIQDAEIVSAAGAAGTFAAKTTGSVESNNVKLLDCTVNGATAAGGVAAETAGSAAFNGAELIDCTVVGATAAGGLAGAVDSGAQIENCRLYMFSKRGENKACFVQWMSASSGAAGGLIGRASGDVAIEKSLAATVVRGSTYAGGLVGRADGALNVEKSYANCYLNAQTIGGLAGSCGGGSSFTSCYSAGFAMMSGINAAAGFVPSAASVTDSYTVFCFDDATTAKLDNGAYIPTPAPDTMTRYALTAGGEAKNAYYTYENAQAGKAARIDKKELETKKIAGFTTGNQSNDYYSLTDPKLEPSGTYPYPTLGLHCYNDFFVPDSDPVKLYRVTVTGWGDDPVMTDESVTPGTPFAVTRLSGGRVIVPASVPRTLQHQIFVGWFDKDHLPPEAKDALIEWCAQVDGLDIVGERFDGVPESLGAQKETVEGDNHYVAASDRVEEEHVLYAVYREVKEFDIVVQFMSFNKDAWKDSNAPTLEKYMGVGTFAVRQPIVYTVDPIVYALNGENYKTAEMEFNLSNNDEKSELFGTDYAVVDEYYQAHLTGVAKNIPPVVCVDKDQKFLDVTGAFTSTSEDGPKTLKIQLDQKRTYIVLCSADMIKVPVQLVFQNSKAPSGTKTEFSIEEYSTTEARLAAVEKALEKVNYSANAEDTYTATFWMRFPPNVIMWSEIPEVGGFELLRDKIDRTTITKNSTTADKAPYIPYARTPFTLAFNLDGGVCEVTENGKTEKHSALDSITDMHYREPVKARLPQTSKLSRPGYLFDGWDFYQLETYGPEAAVLGTLAVKSTGQNTVQYDGDYNMPLNNVIAVAKWKDVSNPTVRVEIYVQNVTDDKSLCASDTNENTDKRTYSFYNAYTVAPEDLSKSGTRNIFEEYKKKTDVNDLLKNAYLDMLCNDGKKHTVGKTSRTRKLLTTGVSTQPDVTISTNDPREYLRDAHNDTINGAILNYQLRFNPFKSKQDGKFVYEFDASGAAVFRVYYDRELITFNFKNLRFHKLHNDPANGYGDYDYVTIGYSNGTAFAYINYDWRYAYILRDAYIDAFAADYAGSWASVTYENLSTYFEPLTSASEQIIEGENYDYVFARYERSENYCFLVPCYDSGDLSAAAKQGCQWTDVGLTTAKACTGLYESKCDEWPGKDGSAHYSWTISIGGANLPTPLSYLETYYDDVWIEGKDGSGYGAWNSDSGRKAHTVTFTASNVNGNTKIYFYLEKDNSGTDAKLRAYMDDESKDHSKSSIDSAVNGWVSSGGKSLFKSGDNYAYQHRNNGGTWYLTNKFAGYTVKGYSLGDNGGFVSAKSGDSVTRSYTRLNVYNLRNWSYVYFGNTQNVPDEAYFYGTALDRLPDMTNKSYYPSGTEFSFQGWFTENNGHGHRLVVGKMTDGVFTEVTEGDGEWVGGTGCTVYEMIPNGEVNGYDYVPFRMPSSNLRIFAYFMTENVTVSFYSRLPVNNGAEPDAETPVVYTDAHLFKPIPAEEFAAIESAWGLTEMADPRPGNGDKTIRVYTVPGTDIVYAFDGWYRYTGEGAPTHDEKLLSRFHEQEQITTPKKLTLAAQWTQIAGKAPYDIVCYLLDKDGKLQPDQSDKTGYKCVRIKASEHPNQLATVGDPLSVPEPSKSDFPALEDYYTSPLSSVKRFERGMDIEFFCRLASTWVYHVVNQVKYTAWNSGASQTVLMSDTENTTAKKNVVVYPDEIDGYKLTDSALNKAQEIRENSENKTARFEYKVDPNSISQPAMADWILGKAAPKLLEITNGTQNKLACADENLRFITYYAVGDNATKYEALPDLGCGTYMVTITIELCNVSSGAPNHVLTVYSGKTILRVYSTVTLKGTNTTLYYDGEKLSILGDSGNMLSADADIADAIATVCQNNPGKKFLGFFDGSTKVIDANGDLVEGSIHGDAVELTPKFN